MTGYVTKLIINDGTCWGACILNPNGEFLPVFAKSTILATGGGTGVFENNMGNNAGCADGCALAHQAGAQLANLEFIQFAIGIKKTGKPAFLPVNIENLTRKIVDDNGQPLSMHDAFDNLTVEKVCIERSKHMPFSSRSISALVDLAIADFIQSGRKLYYINELQKKELIEISHFAHAFNGGIQINAKGESSVPGLFAAGEAATGSHGADRIGGCMMTATQVFGKRAGHFAAKRAKAVKRITTEYHQHLQKIRPIDLIDNNSRIFEQLAIDIGKAMQRYATVIRTAEGLSICLKRIDEIQTQLDDMNDSQAMDLKKCTRLKNLIITAKLIVNAALIRKESKGGHFRQDFPPLHLNPLKEKII
jgi:succinate dehydrogenase/fumarate reductase flavoprotein subunit